jgi:hypothetical protein
MREASARGDRAERTRRRELLKGLMRAADRRPLRHGSGQATTDD